MALAAAVIPIVAGCATEPDSHEIRLAGQRAMLEQRYAAARGLFLEVHDMEPEDPINLHDLGDCCLYFARIKFAERNYAAAMREVDQAVAFYSRAINARPGFQPALIGKNIALELKGQFEEALKVAEWAATFVGPSARQQVFLADELAERGDADAALLRYRQAVAIEPDSADAHEALGRFLARHDERALAIAHLRKAYRLDPNRAGVSMALAELGASVTAESAPAEAR